MRTIVVLAIAASLAPIPAFAQAKGKDAPVPPPVYDAVVACEAITEGQARLQCFDRTVAALATAIRDKKVVVLDSASVREARRGIFGLSLPRLKLFDSDDDEPMIAIDSTITGVRTAKDGMPIFILEDGARWKQTEGRNVYAQVGQPIHIRRAAMGSYMANVRKQPGVRVVRLAD